MWFQRLKLEYPKLLPTFAFNFNLRHYIKKPGDRIFGGWLNLDTDPQYFSHVPGTHAAPRRGDEVERCRLTVSKPVFQVPMVSALETISLTLPG